jgi:AcrR family transcriptional regulator
VPPRPLTRLQPRKTPLQARAVATVDAMSEATIQVLLRDGADRLTTTRVAERCGVSVGTLYQYYPNKDALLASVLAAHLDRVAAALEEACERARGRPLAAMVRTVVEAFVDAKLERADISLALYHVAPEVGGPALGRRLRQRSRKALDAMLRTAPDLKAPLDPFAIDLLSTTMAAATRHVIEAGATPALTRDLRRHLVLLCQAYVAAAAGKQLPGRGARQNARVRKDNDRRVPAAYSSR